MKTNSDSDSLKQENTQQEHGGGGKKDDAVKVKDQTSHHAAVAAFTKQVAAPKKKTTAVAVASTKQVAASAPKKKASRRTKQHTAQTCATSEEGDFFHATRIGRFEIEPNPDVQGNGNGNDNGDNDDDERSTLSDLTVAESGREKNGCFSSWSVNRRWTALGCLSSATVLTVRLLLDREPTAYFIHSWIVFVDMVLIHCFTKSVWLSATGELLTVIFFLSFHFTKETVFELAETTLIAVICSIHMIRSRSKALDKMEFFEEIVEEMSRSQEMSIRSASASHLLLSAEGSAKGEEKEEEDDMHKMEEGVVSSGLRDWLGAPSQLELRKRSKRWGRHFFEHFLDGSAGVMYTSFVGLIISEIINYGSSKSYKCE